MEEKILCFSLCGYTLGVEPYQVEKILVNKNPSKDSFTLETGVEVKSLKSCIPLPETGESEAGNILFIRDQKDFYGFTVNRVLGYLKLKGKEKVSTDKGKVPIKYFVRSEDSLIPVLDLQYITNNENSVREEDILEITGHSFDKEPTISKVEQESLFQEVSEEEVFKSIDEEITQRKSIHYADEIIKSEKRGVVLPLIVNIVIIIIFSAGLLFYLIFNKERVREQIIGEEMRGVEEEVIKEIRRRSEEEVQEQKEKLKDAKKRLEALQTERDFFLDNQDRILSEKERELNEVFQKKLEDSQKRIIASGAPDMEEAFRKERERLYREFLESKEKAQLEIDDVKKRYEGELRLKEERIRDEVNVYTRQIDAMQQRLAEEQKKSREAEERFQTTIGKLQEYISFRKELSKVYATALGFFSKQNYSKGIEELKTLLPVIQSVKEKGFRDEAELQVEERLVNSILFLAEREKNRIDLNQVGKNAFDTGVTLEKDGRLKEALYQYFTVYTIVSDPAFKEKALKRAEKIMETMFSGRSEMERKAIEEKANALFDRAMELKRNGAYELSLSSLEKLITDFTGSSKGKQSLDEIVSIKNLLSQREGEEEKRQLNQKASEIMKQANSSYVSGYYSEALIKYGEIIRNLSGSDYTEKALAEIIRINEEVRKLNVSPALTVSGSKRGVIIQEVSGGMLLFNLGADDGIKKGDVLQLFRKEGVSFSFVGSLKVQETNPTLSKGKIMYYEREPKIGDIVSY